VSLDAAPKISIQALNAPDEPNPVYPAFGSYTPHNNLKRPESLPQLHNPVPRTPTKDSEKNAKGAADMPHLPSSTDKVHPVNNTTEPRAPTTKPVEEYMIKKHQTSTLVEETSKLLYPARGHLIVFVHGFQGNGSALVCHTLLLFMNGIRLSI
jgi:hypothetical protein